MQKNLPMNIYTRAANKSVSLTHSRNSITERCLIWKLCHKIAFHHIIINSKGALRWNVLSETMMIMLNGAMNHSLVTRWECGTLNLLSEQCKLDELLWLKNFSLYCCVYRVMSPLDPSSTKILILNSLFLLFMFWDISGFSVGPL